MVMRIEKTSEGTRTVLQISGRMGSEHVQELKAQVEGSATTVALDLEQVRLVDRDAVHFLAMCEAKGIEFRNCPPFVREWMRSEAPGNSGLE